MPPRQDRLTDEQVRILRAARDERLAMNGAGRWVIDGEARPARKEREKLMRWGYLTWLYRRESIDLVISATGRGALKHYEGGLAVAPEREGA